MLYLIFNTWNGVFYKEVYLVHNSAILPLPYDRWHHSTSGRYHMAQDTHERLRRGQAHLLVLRTIKSLTKKLFQFFWGWWWIQWYNYFPLDLISLRFHHLLSLTLRTISTHKTATILVTEYLISFPSRKHFTGVVTTALLKKLCVILCNFTGRGFCKTRLGFLWMYLLWVFHFDDFALYIFTIN